MKTEVVMKRDKIYELGKQYHDLITEYGDGDDFGAWNERLDEITGVIDVKITNIALVVKQLVAEENALADEIKRLQTKKSARAAKIQRLKDYMLDGMLAAGLDKTIDVRAEVRVQVNPPSVTVLDEQAIPADYWIAQDPKLDKLGIIDALKAGSEVSGAAIKQTKGIRIR